MLHRGYNAFLISLTICYDAVTRRSRAHVFLVLNLHYINRCAPRRGPCAGRRVQPVFRKVAFRVVKGRLSACKRMPFAAQKTAFWKTAFLLTVCRQFTVVSAKAINVFASL